MSRDMSRWQYRATGTRDLRIDWLRGLAMTCVIVDHSKISSLLTWFSYERFWIVTAAEVFVVLSGVVLGKVYGRRLARSDWRGVIGGLSRRALTLYVAFVAVTLSVIALPLLGIDVSVLTSSGGEGGGGLACFVDPPSIGAEIVRNAALMRCGPWAFQIIGLYVWLVAAAVPCLVVLHFAGWVPLVAASWGLYLLHTVAPRVLTTGAFEAEFPILPWQLLFVHGLMIGYYAQRVSAFVTRCPRVVPILVGGASTAFVVLAMCNPWSDGPSALHWSLVSPDRFTDVYVRYFSLRDLGIGRVVNLAVSLPIGYAVLTRCWALVRPIGAVFLTLGQQSLGAFVLHVYGLVLLAHLPLDPEAFWTGTFVQILLVVTIAGLLNGLQRLRSSRREPPTLIAPRPLAA